MLVVGAHWDTTGFTDGYNDNGSGGKNTTDNLYQNHPNTVEIIKPLSEGVAAMIEVARALVKSKCQLKYSTIFVAFDKEEVDVISVKMKSIVPFLYLNFRSGVKAVMSSFVDF